MKYSDSDDDSNVFHLSLTEIAFLIILALVLLLGFPLKEHIEELEALQNCRMQQSDPKVNPDEPESLLLPCDRCVANRYGVSLQEAKRIQEIGHLAANYFQSKEDLSEEDIEKFAETLQSSEKLVERIREMESEAETLKEAAAETENLRELNEALRKENAALARNNNRLTSEKETLQNKLYYGGDFPPCMQGQTLRPNGKPYKWDNLFRIYMKEDRVYVSFANDEAINHPALDSDLRRVASELVSMSNLNKGISWQAFDNVAADIFNWSERQEPRCRLAIVLENRINSRREADEKRMRYIESRFYKQEILERR